MLFVKRSTAISTSVIVKGKLLTYNFCSSNCDRSSTPISICAANGSYVHNQQILNATTAPGRPYHHFTLHSPCALLYWEINTLNRSNGHKSVLRSCISLHNAIPRLLTPTQITIATDCDDGLLAAIYSVLPQSKNRTCRWHIAKFCSRISASIFTTEDWKAFTKD